MGYAPGRFELRNERIIFRTNEIGKPTLGKPSVLTQLFQPFAALATQFIVSGVPSRCGLPYIESSTRFISTEEI